MDGFEATAGIRKWEALQQDSHIPIVALTASLILFIWRGPAGVRVLDEWKDHLLVIVNMSTTRRPLGSTSLVKDFVPVLTLVTRCGVRDSTVIRALQALSIMGRAVKAHACGSTRCESRLTGVTLSEVIIFEDLTVRATCNTRAEVKLRNQASTTVSTRARGVAA